MTPLSAHNLPEHIDAPRYNRDAVKAGVVHFGIGNFHRAHQAVYIDELLSRGDMQWGITGVSLRSASMRDALKPQDYLYTLAVLGEATEYRVIGALMNILVAPENPQSVIDMLAQPDTQLVTSTITEKGYNLTSGRVDMEHPALKAELASLDSPTTIYGFLARGIIARRQTDSASKLTIMCCDNISGGGEHLKAGTEYLLAAHNEPALGWSKDHVSFISSMVDRVSPATDDGLRDKVAQATQRQDVSPVSAEPFTQWIIEDNFAGQRPEFDKVGAIFIDDIAPYERMKLQYLNAAHTIISTLGYLSGEKFVHGSMQRPPLFNFMRQALNKNILPNAAVPDGYDGRVYIADVIGRFQNGNLPYANLQVGTDSSQKIQQRWFPTIEHAIINKADTSYFEFALGAWVIFIHTALKNNVLNDPKRSDFEAVKTASLKEMGARYLEIANGAQFSFYSDADFMRAVTQYAETIKSGGIEPAINDFLAAQK